MRLPVIIGIVLIVLGVIALVVGGITYTTQETVLEVGPLKAEAEKAFRTVKTDPTMTRIAKLWLLNT